MSIRFKFRSSSAFDSIDLSGRRSISVRDLRSKIVAKKNLQICKDFDLVIYDAETGKALEDVDHQIKEGSTVVIKRVPVHCDSDVGDAVRKDEGCVDSIATEPSKNVDKENFDDFGADLYPILEGSLPESYNDASYVGLTADETKVVPRCSEPSGSRCQNVERSDISEAMSKEVIGDNYYKEFDIEEIPKQIKLEPKQEVHQMMDEHIVMPLSTMDMDLPTELRCSLCSAIFNEAVMIPCCQHSFCEKCIRSALAASGSCPKCYSMKCTADALLPNVSLRQAIKHFLEAQATNNALENKITQYVPDVESGIHVKEVSCGMSIQKKETPCRLSSSATGKRSNQVMAGEGYENKLSGGMVKSAHLPLKIKRMKGDENCSAEVFNHMSGFHGIHSSSMMPHNFLREEDESGNLRPSSRYRKGDRNCYMCGSPNHLIRDCPAVSNSYPFNHTGTLFTGGMPVYGQTYWQGNTFPQAMAYMNAHGTPALMPFNPTMGPILPLGIPRYMPSMYMGTTEPYGFMRVGGVQPPMTPGAERRLTCQAFVGPQAGEQKHNNRHLESEHDFDDMREDYYYRKNQRISCEQRHQLNKENNGSFSDDDSLRIRRKHTDNKHYGSSHRQTDTQSDEELSSIERKYERGSHQSVSRRENKARHYGRINSESQGFSDSCNWHGREKKGHCHGNCSENQCESSGQHRSLKKMSGDHMKVVTDLKKHNHRHHNHSQSSFKPNLSNDGRHHHKDKKASHSSRSSRQNLPNSEEDRLKYGRWKMVDGMDDEYRGVDHHKCRRTW